MDGLKLSRTWRAGNSYQTSIHPNPSTQLSMAKSADDLKMKQKANFLTRQLPPLSAFTSSITETDIPLKSISIPQNNFDMESISAIISCSLLITGNTVGAGTIVLPEVAAGPGMLSTLELVFGIFIINLISGLLIGEIAINQYEQNIDTTKDAPSSFKDLADDLLTIDGLNVGQIVSAASILINYCIVSFALMRSGEVAVDLASALKLTDPTFLSESSLAIGFTAIVTALVSTQSRKTLSQVTSGAVALLFLSFGSILLPGLANMQQDVLTTLTTPGTSESVVDGMSVAAPIFVSTMVYQNIVPTVTKLLEYDRTKVMTTLSIGSAIPMIIYTAWCFAVLGGGISMESSGGTDLQSILLMIFSTVSISGSSIACTMSLSEEFRSQLPSNDDGLTKSESDFSLPSVALAVLPPLCAGLLFSNGEGMRTSLELAGSFGSPLLYGILPALLAWKQKKIFTQSMSKRMEMVPGGELSQVLLMGTSMAFIGAELFGNVGSFL